MRIGDSLILIGALVIPMIGGLFSGCVQAKEQGRETKEIAEQISPEPTGSFNLVPAKRSVPVPGQNMGSEASEDKWSTFADQKPPGQNPTIWVRLSEKAQEQPAAQHHKPTEKPQTKISSKPLKEFLPREKSRPICQKTAPPAKSSNTKEKPQPIYGLPLEYHFDLPEVPQRIRGPTPMPVVSKPTSPGPVPK
ncbi:MAG: hypothetical protein NZ602_01145 [Thermoguttaceae bacterium]|nr:hypothetical protein [Thermoguttaceae bacterium]MDW8036576.1 hypothetical protein [Thermoguttaceae bacterium]